jgi:ribosome modulation factor
MHLSWQREPDPVKLSREGRSNIDRAKFDWRYRGLVRSRLLFQQIHRQGFLAGKFNQSKRKNPAKDGEFHWAWLAGWTEGMNERAKLIDVAKSTGAPR